MSSGQGRRRGLATLQRFAMNAVIAARPEGLEAFLSADDAMEQFDLLCVYAGQCRKEIRMECGFNNLGAER